MSLYSGNNDFEPGAGSRESDAWSYRVHAVSNLNVYGLTYEIQKTKHGTDSARSRPQPGLKVVISTVHKKNLKNYSETFVLDAWLWSFVPYRATSYRTVTVSYNFLYLCIWVSITVTVKVRSRYEEARYGMKNSRSRVKNETFTVRQISS